MSDNLPDDPKFRATMDRLGVWSRDVLASEHVV